MLIIILQANAEYPLGPSKFCTLTALSDKWVHIMRCIGSKVDTVEKVGELNWCSPSRGSLVESYLRREG